MQMFLGCSIEQKAAREENMHCFCGGVGSRLVTASVFSRASHRGNGGRLESSDLACADLSYAVEYTLLLLLLYA